MSYMSNRNDGCLFMAIVYPIVIVLALGLAAAALGFKLALLFWIVVFVVYVLETLGLVTPGSACKIAELFPGVDPC